MSSNKSNRGNDFSAMAKSSCAKAGAGLKSLFASSSSKQATQSGCGPPQSEPLSPEIQQKLERRWRLINVGLNSDRLDMMVTNCSGQWRELARKLPDRTSIGSNNSHARFYQEADLARLAEASSDSERCRAAIVEWMTASSEHGLRALVQAMKDAKRGLCAEELLQSVLEEIENSADNTEAFAAESGSDVIIKHSELDMAKQTVGESSQGSMVDKATWRRVPVAVKRLRESECSDRMTRREYSVLKTLRHPNVLTVYGILALDVTCAGIVLELADTSLQQRYRKQPHLDFAETVDILADLADGLAYLHARCIVHRAISSSNILLFLSDDPCKSPTAKIGDFRLAKSTAPGWSLELADNMLFTPATPYTAPEYSPRAEGEAPKYSLLVDVYAAGCVGVEVLLRQLPASPNDLSWEEQLSAQGCPKDFIDLLKACLSQEPVYRPSSEALMSGMLTARGGSTYTTAVEQRLATKSDQAERNRLKEKLADSETRTKGVEMAAAQMSEKYKEEVEKRSALNETCLEIEAQVKKLTEATTQPQVQHGSESGQQYPVDDQRQEDDNTKAQQVLGALVDVEAAIYSLHQDVSALQDQLAKTSTAQQCLLEEQDTTLSRHNSTVSSLNASLRDKTTQEEDQTAALKSVTDALEERNAEVNRLKAECADAVAKAENLQWECDLNKALLASVEETAPQAGKE
ncbi:sperm motility kinase Y-like [Sycon ciliatum]|uniref:sperm motility kinase Y-like n=1 Tax=Sycon ciliatum TaxID=27933 RepID=UPI0031F628CC